MDEWVGEAMWRTRVGMWVLSAFAALALLLTAIGVFGVMAQTVMQRTPEIGLPMALGAQRRDVLTLVLPRAVLVTGAGLVIGVACAPGAHAPDDHVALRRAAVRSDHVLPRSPPS